MKNNKAPGPDGIPVQVQVYKALPQHMLYTDTLVLDPESTLRGGQKVVFVRYTKLAPKVCKPLANCACAILLIDPLNEERNPAA
jgi:hypothetical protein